MVNIIDNPASVTCPDFCVCLEDMFCYSSGDADREESIYLGPRLRLPDHTHGVLDPQR